MNICFTSDKNLLKEATLINVEGFREITAPPPNNIDVLVLDGNGDVSGYIDKNIDTCIFSSSNALKILELKNVNSAVSCGMQGLDTVTFSSISEDSALVCIRRRIVFCKKVIDPCEFKAPFHSHLGLYKNLVISLLRYLAQSLGENNETV